MSTKPIQDCGQLPLVLGDIHGAEIGSVLVDCDEFSEIKNPDSYQERGLNLFDLELELIRNYCI